MSRYIDADKLFLHFNDWALAVSPDERHSDLPEYSEHKIHEMIYRTINEAMSAIEQQPTADVVERKHGEWLETSESIGWEEVGCAECSVCGKTLVLGDYTMDDIKFNYNYCPNCGADMREILPKP